jgi:hypothetical protein
LTKYCHTCKRTKNRDEFHNHKLHSDGKASKCKSCKSEYAKRPEVKERSKVKQRIRYQTRPEVREAHRKQHAEWSKTEIGKKCILNSQVMFYFGITADTYLEMVKRQNNKCAICKKTETATHPRHKTVKRLSVDHDHISGKVRELLCQACNTSLGSLGDSIELLQSAIDYLKKHEPADERQLEFDF